MRKFDDRYGIEGVARQMKREASSGRYTGRVSELAEEYLDRTTSVHIPTLSLITFNREYGMADKGLFPDVSEFNRAYTLRVAFLKNVHMVRDVYRPGLGAGWVRAFFEDESKVWLEKHKTASKAAPWDFHVFCDEQWNHVHLRKQDHVDYLLSSGWCQWEDLEPEMRGLAA